MCQEECVKLFTALQREKMGKNPIVDQERIGGYSRDHEWSLTALAEETTLRNVVQGKSKDNTYIYGPMPERHEYSHLFKKLKHKFTNAVACYDCLPTRQGTLKVMQALDWVLGLKVHKNEVAGPLCFTFTVTTLQTLQLFSIFSCINSMGKKVVVGFFF
jgi:hypothetical protein